MGVVMFVWLMGFLVSGLLVLSLVTPSGQSPIRVGNNRPPSLAACKRRGGAIRRTESPGRKGNDPRLLFEKKNGVGGD